MDPATLDAHSVVELDYIKPNFRGGFHAIWASHVLEHQPNVGLFIQKMHRELVEDGWLFVIVPPSKPAIVGGHLTIWNAGLLLYNLIVNGFDCRDAMVHVQGYNIGVFVRKHTVEIPALRCDSGDIETLAEFFPVPVRQGFDGCIEANWEQATPVTA